MKILPLLFAVLLTAAAALGASPEISVEQPPGTTLPDGGSKDFGSVAVGAQTNLTFTITNSGNADLTGLLGATVNGAAAAMFTILFVTNDYGFTLASSPALAPFPEEGVVADVNGDGKMDLISVAFANDSLTVLTNNGSGGFALSSSQGVGDGPNWVTAADVNGDGKVDLITADQIGTLTVLTNNGSGGFVLSSSLSAGDYPTSVVAADVNGDGKTDLISGNLGPSGPAGFEGNTLTVLTNNGRGGFVLASSPVVGAGLKAPRNVMAADVNGDGKVDLISVNTGDSTLSVLTNNGSGGFLLASSPTGGGGASTLADVNGDGKVDLISMSSLNRLEVLTNNGSGGFVSSSSHDVGAYVSSIAAGDINGDGKVDLISASTTGDNLSVLTNNGSGGFALSSSPVVGGYPSFVSATDFNGDGKLDLATLNADSSTWSVLFNARTTLPSATVKPAGSTTLTVRFAPTSAGAKTATLHIPNNDPDENPYDLTLTGTGANTPPVVANPIPDQVALQNALFSFTFATNTFADMDAGTVFTYSATGVPAWLNFTPATRTFSGTQTGGNGGFVDVTVTATDNGAPPAIVSDTFRITLVPQPEISVQQPPGTTLPDGGGKNFGAVFAGFQTNITFTITNSGGTNLTGLSATLDGADAAMFSIVLTTSYPGVFTLSSAPGVGSDPRSVTAADVNGDGKVDLISGNTGPETLSVLTNNGTGGFVLSSSPTVGGSPFQVVAADVNGDGKVDLISANSFAGTLSVLTNNGTGGFVLHSSPAVGNSARSVAAADINGDGKVDLIAAILELDQLVVLTNNGSGGFGPPFSLAVGAQPIWVVAADVNGDGKVDLISANSVASTLSVLTNNGSGGFALSSSPAVVSGPISVVAADINGDGKVDLITANILTETLSVLTNNGSGGFALASSPGVGTDPYSVIAADLNGDGRLDLVSANDGDNTLSVLLNNGSGAFTLATSPGVGIKPRSVVAVDVNGDGRLDLVSADRFSSALTVLTNTPITGYLAATVAPEGSTTLTVRFAPTSVGAKTAMLHITSNDADESPYDLTLTGTGKNPPPAVTTLAASGVTGTNATLNGDVNPGGLNTLAYFQYGLTTNYGSFSATNSLAATNITGSVSNLISSLSPYMAYHFRLVAANSAGTNAGADMTFTTGVPIVTTAAATSVTASNATLNGTVNPNGAATTAYFQYGLTTNYGSFSATNNLAATNTAQAVSNLISGLAPGTTYHFRIVGISSAGLSMGVDGIFNTTPLAPTVTTLSASGITGTSVTLNGTVNPNGAATKAYFQYGLTTNYGSFSATNNLAATNASQAVSNLISLSRGTTYHFRLVAFSSVGSVAGADQPIVIPQTFTGAGSIQGLDLQGTFLYAVNVGSNGAPGLIGQANFTADNVSGVTITAPGNTLKTVNAWATPNFGATTDGVRLAQAMSSIRWTSVPGILTVNLDGLQIGSSYQLQLLFLENSDDRVFNVKVNGTTIVPGFRLLDYGPMGTAIVIPYIFTATATNALIQLGGGTGGVDNNPLLSAFTLEILPRNFNLIGPIRLPGGAFRFSFTNLGGLGFTVLGTTNLTLPLSNWTVLGAPTEAPTGKYQFTDPQATNSATRFYRVRSP